MHRNSPCPHCLRRKILLCASAFFFVLGLVGMGSTLSARVTSTPELVQTAAR
jgi:hypothetical protein